MPASGRSWGANIEVDGRPASPDAPIPRAAWQAVSTKFFATAGVPVQVPFRRVLGNLMAERIDPVLYKLSRDYVGDTAETVALLWPDSVSGVLRFGPRG